MTQNRELGDLGENISARYLVSKGYEIILQNYAKPWGEIDIIAKHGEIVVFVEVKSSKKKSEGAFNPELRADLVKLNKVIKTAMLFLEYELKSQDTQWRVDVISVIFDDIREKANITHFKNAGEAWS